MRKVNVDLIEELRIKYGYDKKFMAQLIGKGEGTYYNKIKEYPQRNGKKQVFLHKELEYILDYFKYRHEPDLTIDDFYIDGKKDSIKSDEKKLLLIASDIEERATGIRDYVLRTMSETGLSCSNVLKTYELGLSQIALENEVR